MQAPETEVIVTGPDGAELLRTALMPGEYVIGRDMDCELRILADFLSQKHARLTIGPDLLIEDLGASDGALLDSQPVRGSVRLAPNQKIQIGAATLELRRLQAPPEALRDAAARKEETFPLPPPRMPPPSATDTLDRLLPKEFLRERKYDIGPLIARGGMGAVLDAKEATIERKVAMKVMLDDSKAEDLTRFIGEARITGQLEHPNIVPVHELGVDENGRVFYTMKLVRGITLRKALELMADGDAAAIHKYPLAGLLTIFQKVCDAVAFAHSKSVIHRDLKPENIMLGDFGEVLLMDWGLAKLLPREGAPSAPATEMLRSMVRSVSLAESGAEATLEGCIMGTPQYMAPEQARGDVDAIDARTDVYALGAILFHLLYLRPSVSGKSVAEILEKVKTGALDWPGLKSGPLKKLAHLPGGSVPDSLRAVCRKALAPDLDMRYPSAAGLQKDIVAYQNGFATTAERAGLGKQLALLIKRHKAVFSTAFLAWLIITILAVWFVIKVTASERRATTALNDLRKTAPTFFEQAKLLTDNEKFLEALEKIDIALALNPSEASFLNQRGNILQSMERFSEAADAYESALRLSPKDAVAASNAELSRILAAHKADNKDALSAGMRTRWRNALLQQGRHAEAIFASEGLVADAKKMLPSWQAKLDAWLGKGAPRIVLLSDGFYGLDLSSLGLHDLTPLEGMPVEKLEINNNPQVKDLTPLADSPLRRLDATTLPALVDLEPLRGKDLVELRLDHSNITSLDALSEMRNLESLTIATAPVTDLTPIRHAKLKYFGAQATKIRNIDALRGQPLETAYLGENHFASLDPLADAPLEILQIEDCGDLDLASLKTRKMRYLAAQGTVLNHLEVLAEMRGLEIITLPKNMSDPAILRNLPRLRKIDAASYSSAFGKWENLKDAAIFWREYDAKRAAQSAGKRLIDSKREALAAWQAKVDAWLGKNAPRIAPLADGTYQLDLSNHSLSDLEPLRGMPLSILSISFNPRIKDLRPLADCPLKRLEADNLPGLCDLEPLRGKDLLQLKIDRSQVVRLDALSDMRNLNWLTISGTGVSDLTPIRNAKLNRFSAETTLIRNLDALRGQPLGAVYLGGTRFNSLSPLADAPLEILQIEACGHLDLASLHTRKLRRLAARDTELDHLEVLLEMKDLEIITLPKNLADPSILRRLPRLRKIDTASYSSMAGNWEKLKDTAVFWREFDAQQAAKKK